MATAPENLDPETVLAEGMAALRESEVVWLADSLSFAISNLGYPVGMGNAPHPVTMRKAAETVFDRYAKIVELAAGRRLSKSLLAQRGEVRNG